MDLSTVKRKLKNGSYSELSQVVTDLMLIWQNCRTYNMAGSLIVQQANVMEKHMVKYCQKQKIPIETQKQKAAPEPVPQIVKQETGVSFDEKVDLSEQVKKVGHDILGQIVNVIQNECPTAIEELDKDRIQIKVDNLDKQTFYKIQEQVLNSIVKQSLRVENEGPYKRQKRGV